MKYLIMILFLIVLNNCWVMPVSQRANCDTERENVKDLTGWCDLYLFITFDLYSSYPNESFAQSSYNYAISQCYREIEYKKKCQSKSPYIPDWPPVQ